VPATTWVFAVAGCARTCSISTRPSSARAWPCRPVSSTPSRLLGRRPKKMASRSTPSSSTVPVSHRSTSVPRPIPGCLPRRSRLRACARRRRRSKDRGPRRGPRSSSTSRESNRSASTSRATGPRTWLRLLHHHHRRRHRRRRLLRRPHLHFHRLRRPEGRGQRCAVTVSMSNTSWPRSSASRVSLRSNPPP
jgi:hypothetical protein